MRSNARRCGATSTTSSARERAGRRHRPADLREHIDQLHLVVGQLWTQLERLTARAPIVPGAATLHHGDSERQAFARAHAAGMQALKDGDLAGLKDAIDREGQIIDEQSVVSTPDRPADGDNRGLPRNLLGRPHRDERPIEQQVVDDLQRAGDEERQVDQRRPREHETRRTAD